MQKIPSVSIIFFPKCQTPQQKEIVMYEMVDPLPGALKLPMPQFVTAWSIVDLVMVSLRTLELPFIAAALLLIGSCQNEQNISVIAGCRLILWLELGMASAIAVLGLTGNIAMLCRRHWALWFTLGSHFVTLVSYGILVWQALIFFKGFSPLAFAVAIISVALFIMLRSALLVFNFISFFKAKAFYRERDGY